MKGISPLVAEVLLIAIAVSVASLFGMWIIGFSKTQTATLQNQTTQEIDCSNANIAFYGTPTYSSGKFSSLIKNTGLIVLKGIYLDVIYDNSTTQRIELCENENSVFECENANLTLYQGDIRSIEVSIDSNIYSIILSSSTCPSVSDKLYKKDISFS